MFPLVDVNVKQHILCCVGAHVAAWCRGNRLEPDAMTDTPDDITPIRAILDHACRMGLQTGVLRYYATKSTSAADLLAQLQAKADKIPGAGE